MSRILTAARWPLFALLLAACTGCGLKGDLVLPDEPPAEPGTDSEERERRDD